MLNVLDISKLGIGGWGLGGLATYDPKVDEQKQIDALSYTIKKGINFFEVNFWNSEGHSVDIIHKAIQKSGKKREEVFLPLVIYDYKNHTLLDVEKEIEKFFTKF